MKKVSWIVGLGIIVAVAIFMSGCTTIMDLLPGFLGGSTNNVDTVMSITNTPTN